MEELNLPLDTKYILEHGSDMDLTQMAKKLIVPKTKHFRFVKYLNPNTSRWSQILICDMNCGKLFRKWHNLFDHMRVHENDKPFECPVAGCHYDFTQ